MDADMLTRARAVVERLRGAEGKATPGPWHSDWYDYYIGIGAAGELCDVLQADGDGVPQLVISPEDMEAIVALRNAAAPLLALAEAVGRLADGDKENVPWWGVAAQGSDWPYWRACKFCGAESCASPSPWRPPPDDHVRDCPALALERAFADLAELAALGGGEVG